MTQRTSDLAAPPRSQDGAESASPVRSASDVVSSLLQRIDMLEVALAECLEYLESQEDVVDGDDGEPRPNRAMQLAMLLDQTLTSRGIR